MDSRKISDRGVALKSTALQNCRIGFGVCGGIGSVEVVKIIRELRRHDALVTCFVSPSALKFITALSLEWACAKAPVLELGAQTEQLERFDLVLVAPATLNTISKAAAGIIDTPVLGIIAAQLGSGSPLGIIPTMNEVLARHPSYGESSARLRRWGVHFFPETFEENRLKMPSPEQVLNFALEILSRRV